MLRRLIAEWPVWRGAVRHPVMLAVFHQSRRRLAASLPPAEYGNLLQACVDEVAATLAAPLPIPAVRAAIFALMPVAARVAVVGLARDDSPFPRFLSGELGRHAAALSARDEMLAATLSGATASERYRFLRLRLDNLDLARRALGDCDADPRHDWFVPAWVSACIFREDAWRGELGLPGLLPPAQAMYCSGWHELAAAGERHLRALWEDGWQEAFGAPSPFRGWDGSDGAGNVSAGADAAGAPSLPTGR